MKRWVPMLVLLMVVTLGGCGDTTITTEMSHATTKTKGPETRITLSEDAKTIRDLQAKIASLTSRLAEAETGASKRESQVAMLGDQVQALTKERDQLTLELDPIRRAAEAAAKRAADGAAAATTAGAVSKVQKATEDYYGTVEGRIKQWYDLIDVAESTSRLQLDGVIAKLQGVRKVVSEIDVSDRPEEVQAVNAYLVQYMDNLIAYDMALHFKDVDHMTIRRLEADWYEARFTTGLSSLRTSGKLP